MGSLLLLLSLIGYTHAWSQETQVDAPSPTATEREALGMDEETPAPTLKAEEPAPAPQPTASQEPLPPKEDPQKPAKPATSLEAAASNLAHRRKDTQRNRWSAGVVVSPRTFRNANWKARPNVNEGNLKNPRMLGIFLQGERILTDRIGVLGLGAEIGIIGSPSKRDGFEDIFPAVVSVGALGSYRFRYVTRQWVVPFLRGGGEFLRYGYHYNSARIVGTRLLPRGEGGLDIYLNAFDPSSARNMYADYSVLRTFLTVAYSFTWDSSKKDLDLGDRALRAGVRFEF